MTEKQRRARKNHRCSLCGEPILKGADYIGGSGRANNFFYEYKYHIACHALVRRYLELHPERAGDYTESEIHIWAEDETCGRCGQDCARLPERCGEAVSKLLPDNVKYAALESMERGEEN